MRYLLRPFALWWRYLPQLVACYLLGLARPSRRHRTRGVGRLGQRRLGVADHAVGRAGPARLVCRDVPGAAARAFPRWPRCPRGRRDSVDVFANIIVPFFAIYLAWQLFAEDWLAFETRALDYRVADDDDGDAAGDRHASFIRMHSRVSTITWVIDRGRTGHPVSCWAGSRIACRAGWLAVRVYVDALWVFLVVSFAANQGVTCSSIPTSWIAERRIVVWFNDDSRRAVLAFPTAGNAWDVLMWALRTVFGGATIPLLWLAVAGIIYGVIHAGLARRGPPSRRRTRRHGVRPRGRRRRSRFSARGSRIPRRVGAKSPRVGAVAQLGNFQHHRRFGATHPARRGAGVVVVRAWLPGAGVAGHGRRFYHARGQHGDICFVGWHGFSGRIRCRSGTVSPTSSPPVSHLIIDPLRICLIASDFGVLPRARQRAGRGTTTATAP